MARLCSGDCTLTASRSSGGVPDAYRASTEKAACANASPVSGKTEQRQRESLGGHGCDRTRMSAGIRFYVRRMDEGRNRIRVSSAGGMRPGYDDFAPAGGRTQRAGLGSAASSLLPPVSDGEIRLAIRDFLPQLFSGTDGDERNISLRFPRCGTHFVWEL